MQKRRTDKLVFVCSKMAAGESTLAKKLAARQGGVRLEQEDMLAALFPGESVDLAALVKF